MSVATSVLLEGSRMPTPEAWAAAVRAHEFDLKLDADFDPRTQTGFLPCEYKGEGAGFEYYWNELSGLTEDEDLDDDERIDPEILAAAGDRDVLVSLLTHSDLSGLLSASIAAAVLAELTGGLVWEEGSDAEDLIPAERAIEWARRLEANAGRC